MIKKLLLLVAFAPLSNFAQTFPAPYCTVNTFTYIEPITLVNFAGINNTSPAATTSPSHENFTAIVGNVVQGESYPISLKGYTGGNYVNSITVYIDWNQNGVFTDPGENYAVGTISNSTGVDAVVLNGTIAVPATATIGTTRMRLVKKFLAAAGVPCGNVSSFGQAEDYSVSVGALGISELNSERFNFYPNPVKDVLTISNATEIKSVKMYNIVGQQVFSREFEDSEITIDLSELRTGNYIVKAFSAEATKTFKISKL